MGALATAARASPIAYTGFTITDGELGSWSFTNARVYLRFEGDTSDVQNQTITDPTTGESADVNLITKGRASVLVVAAEKVVHATFAPNQLFVSLDLGNPNDFDFGPGGRGVGFGSFSTTAPGGIEPAYPLGVEDGTIDWGDAALPSVAVQELPTTLTQGTAFSGRAWVCPGFPDRSCPGVRQALKTSKGDLYLFQPYQVSAPGFLVDTLSPGFFVAQTGDDGWNDLVAAVSADGCREDQGSPTAITYHGYWIADVTLGASHFSAAQIYLSFASDTDNVVASGSGAARTFMNQTGRASATIVAFDRTIRAELAPDQLYVFYDVGRSFLGFGSTAGGPGYPFGLTSASTLNDPNGLTTNSTLGAASDIALNPANASNYSAPTAGLVTDLTNATVLGGPASSCVSLAPATGICSNLTPVPLHTSHGDLFVFESYTDDETTTNDSQPFTINWGVFWSVPCKDDEGTEAD
jgi:hypothetical protein